MSMWCHPELGAQFSLLGILPMVGDVGTLDGGHCSIRRGDQGLKCPCVRVRSNAKSIAQIPGATPDRVALFFADSTRLLQSSDAAVGRVGVPGDGVEARCAGGSAIWGIVSVGKAGQLECRRKLARRAGCSYEGLRLQAPQYVLSSPGECAQWIEATKAGGHGWMLKPTVGSFGRGITYLPPDKAHAEALERCGAGAGRRGRRLLQQKPGPRPTQPRRSWLAMRYVPPMLVGGHKVELRSYLLIARTRPLLAFTHEGIARRADFAYDAASSKPAAHILNLRYDGGKMLGDDHFWSWRKLGGALRSEHDLGAEHMETVVRAEVDRVCTFEVHAMRGDPDANPEVPLTARRGGGSGGGGGGSGGGGSHPLRSFQFFSLDWALGPDGRPSLIEKNAAPGTHPYRSVDGLMPGLLTTMIELVALTQTAPAETLRTMHAGPGAAQFAFGGWRLVHNQLHEQPAAPYNACAVRGHMP